MMINLFNMVWLLVSDNIMPFIAQIILDAYISPDYLHRPRRILSDYRVYPHPRRNLFESKDEGVSHLSLLKELASDGTIGLQAVRDQRLELSDVIIQYYVTLTIDIWRML